MWCIINKPKYVSSNSLTMACRGYFQKKCGHAGTLDRPATGVVPIAIGDTTKWIKFLMEQRKSYVFTMVFGYQTSTGDGAGTVIKRSDHVPNAVDIVSVLHEFVGNIQQAPHPFSVVKINGKRMADLMRRKIKFTVQKRPVYIEEIRLLEQSDNMASLYVKCGSGVYVRSLCEDIAVRLGTVAHVLELSRITVGPFDISCANNLHDLSMRTDEEQSNVFLRSRTRSQAHPVTYSLAEQMKCYPVEQAFIGFNTIALTEREYARIINTPCCTDYSELYSLSCNGKFVGIGTGPKSEIQPVKMIQVQ